MKKSIYEDYSIEQMDALLPKDSHWSFIRQDGYETTDNQRYLMVIVQCRCGKQERKRWSRLRANRLVSCGCIARRYKKEIEITDLLPGEIWKDVISFEALYEVSNLGRVRSKERYITRLNYQFKISPRYFTHVSSRYISNNKYVNIILIDNSVKTQTTIHRLVAQAFINNPNNIPYVNHLNGLKWDNRVENLEWCTPKENTQHAIRTGLLVGRKGESNWSSVLTNEQVLEIRARRDKSIPGNGKQLANEYKITQAIVGDIIARRTWKHI